MTEIEPIRWQGDHLLLLDQTLLPNRQRWLTVRGYRQATAAIREMRVRGAPAIGVTAAYAMALAGNQVRTARMSTFLTRLEKVASELAATRPTAVSLRWAVGRSREAIQHCRTPEEARWLLLEVAQRLHQEDVAANRAISQYGAALLPADAGVLTHCNTGALATAGYGTALGIIRAAWEQGKRPRVFYTETRPWLQGARLTGWELTQMGIPASLIVDSAAGEMMRQGEVQAVVVGADRIAANGDVANKIGTYTLAVLAKEHGVPFYVAAPVSTIDLTTASGADIPLEERPGKEITHWRGRPLMATGTHVRNPVFDITPGRYVTGIIMERGVVEAPYAQELKVVVERQRSKEAA